MADVRTTTERRPVHAGLAALSLGAALIHASAISAHSEHMLLATGFVLAAAAQGAWALAIVARPASRIVLVVGTALNAVLVAVYLGSRLTGLPIEGLETPEPFGFQDLTSAAFETALVAGCVLALSPHLLSGFRRLQALAAGAIVLVVAAVAVPALAAGENHSHGAIGHSHDESVAHDDGHVHEDGTGHEHPTGGVTPEQQARADDLVAETEDALVRWEDPAVAIEDGFRSIGDGRRPNGYEHYINTAYLASHDVLDPEHPESLVYQKGADGSSTLVSAMYILPPGSTMDDVPAIGGPLTPWHDHDNLCWSPDGRIAGILVNGACVPGGEFRGRRRRCCTSGSSTTRAVASPGSKAAPAVATVNRATTATPPDPPP
ncbi:MAG: hypothetical protein ACRDWD_08490 [Acidimicrobiia bacterium]